MKLLAIDTATEHCSVAVLADNGHWTLNAETARGHAEMVLPMIDQVLAESATTLGQLDGLAFGRGPGSFTGVRIGVSVVQGLALSRRLPVVGISNLAAVAQRAAVERQLDVGANILVCMDARMREVYWARYEVTVDGLVARVGDERVGAPGSVDIDVAWPTVGVGTGWQAYAELKSNFPDLEVAAALLPRALEIARLAAPEFAMGRGTDAAGAQPVYLRDRVVDESR